MNNKELENRVLNQLNYGVTSSCDDLIRDLCQEIERLERHVGDVTLLRAKIASEQLAAMHVAEPMGYLECSQNQSEMVSHSVKIADKLLAELAKPKP